MSKRKLLQLVTEGHVSGWDDPRLPTLSGMRRRGYPAAAIRHFCKRIGITKFNGVTDVALLEFDVRDFLNQSAPRRMAVIDPLKVVLENHPSGTVETVELPNHPQDPAMGVRTLTQGAEIWIERDDFMEEPPPKYHRLAPGRHVRLRGGPIIRCTGYEKAADGAVTLVRAEVLPGTKNAPTPAGVQCKAAIHWVDAATAATAEVRLYDRLFTVEDPDGAEGGFLSVLNPDSLQSVTAFVEPALAAAEPGTCYQFERLGYFVADCVEHQPGAKPVFSRTVALRDSWAKPS
jgi:glutaminyl-tRNA synthetase